MKLYYSLYVHDFDTIEVVGLNWDGEVLELDVHTDEGTELIRLRPLVDPVKRAIAAKFGPASEQLAFLDYVPPGRLSHASTNLVTLLDRVPVQRCVEAYLEHNHGDLPTNILFMTLRLWRRHQGEETLPLLEGAALETFLALGMDSWAGSVPELHQAAVRLTASSSA